MKLKTIIIDDEPVALEKLKSYVETVPFLDLVAECQGSTEALEYMSKEGNDVDVIFTDIEMPDINGVAFIESLTNSPLVVFTTAFRDFATDGFRLSAVDYLVKPYRQLDFQRAANKVLEAYKAKKGYPATNGANESVFIKVETRFERVALSDIRYIKGFGEYLQIFVENRREPLLTISSFANLLEKLNPTFIQAHRSYVVNMNKVLRIEKSRIIMDSDVYIPISNTYREQVLEYVNSKAVGREAKMPSEKQ